MSISVIAAAGPNDVTDFRFRGLRKVLVRVSIIVLNDIFLSDLAW